MKTPQSLTKDRVLFKKKEQEENITCEAFFHLEHEHMLYADFNTLDLHEKLAI